MGKVLKYIMYRRTEDDTLDESSNLNLDPDPNVQTPDPALESTGDQTQLYTQASKED